MKSFSRNFRNEYNALINVPQWCQSLMKEAEVNGAWETGIEADKRNRGSAINCDLYGYQEEQGLAVVQVRQAQFHPGRYTRVRKDYYLIGHTEQGGFFAHPVTSPARSRTALESPEGVVDFVLSKVWNCRVTDLPYIERQGDVAFIPVYKIPNSAEKLESSDVMLNESHKLVGECWFDKETETYYTKRGSRLVHLKNQHSRVRAKGGCYRVQVGVRADNWGFTAPMGD